MTAGVVHLTSPIIASGHAGPLLADSDVAPLTVTVPVGTVSGTTPSVTFRAERSLPGLGDYPDVTNDSDWDTTNGVAATAITASTHTASIALPPSVAASGDVGGFWRLKWTVTGTTPSFAVAGATAAG